MQSPPVIESRDVAYRYLNKSVLEGISISVAGGELIALIGPNGSGKTTLLKILLGLLTPSAGEVILDNQSLMSFSATERAKRIAYVSQQPVASFPLTVFELVALGRYPHSPRYGLSSTDRLAVENALRDTQASELATRSFNSLSGGEKQKILIARALAQSAKILLLDEPTLHLDLYYQLQILAALKKLCIDQGAAVITVLHDVNLASLFADKALLLRDGSLSAFGPVGAVLSETSIRELLGVEMKALDGHGTASRYFVPNDLFKR
jgi:iron complex transport system ATP-binding protein